MGDFVHKRNGIIIQPPRDWDELEIKKDFLDKNNDVNINITSLSFAGEEAQKIRERVLSGLNGGLGVFEGDNYTIEVGETGNPVYTFEGYLDYSGGIGFAGCNEVETILKKKEGENWLNDVADSFSFRYLFDIGEINSGDFIKVPYVINYIPDSTQLTLLSLSLFMMTKELVAAIKNIADAAGDVTDANIPVIGIGVGVGAVTVTAWDLGNFILVVVKLVAWIAYTVAIVIAIIKLIEDIVEQILPKKREHLGMRVLDLFRKGAEHLGLSFNSTLLEERREWVLIPSKGHKGGVKPSGFIGNWVESGVPNAGDGVDTFGDLIRVFRRALNADYKIVNGVFYFEREDFWDSLGGYTIPDFFTEQNELKDRFSLNVEEVVANYNINWAYDTQDQNTLDNQEGRVFQAILEPVLVNDRKLVSLSGLEEINIPFSLGLRKNTLNEVERAVKFLGGFVDGLTSFFGAGTNFASNILNRKGSLLTSSHFFTIPKMVVMNGGRLAKKQRDILGAGKLWDELHFINSFAEINGAHNQYYRYKGVKVPFCLEDFITLLNNNNCRTINGERAKIESLVWRVWDNSAVIDYRVNKKYTNNLRLKYI